MKVPAVVKKAVVFLGPPDEPPLATGFLVSHRHSATAPDWQRASYLVTAAHCVPKDGSGLRARINFKDGTAKTLDAPKRWLRHPTDTSIDVAVTPLPSFWRGADVEQVPSETFAHPKAIDVGGYIGEGDEVFIAGLFADSHGDRRNLPVVRTGNIARMAVEDEHIQTDWKDGPVVVHLIEARSIGGISGSPVFARRTVMWTAPPTTAFYSGSGHTLVAYGPEFYLLGLVHGHWDEKNERPDYAGDINMGIAFVVPAQYILQTLNHPDLVGMRERQFAEARKTAKPKLD